MNFWANMDIDLDEIPCPDIEMVDITQIVNNEDKVLLTVQSTAWLLMS